MVGRITGSLGRQGWPSLFLLYNSDFREIYLTIYRANGYLSVTGNGPHNLGWLILWGFRRGFRRGFRPPTTGSSYNIRRTFLPSVHIDGGRRPSLFLLYNSHVREIYSIMHPIPLVSIPIYIKSLELSFSNLHFMVRTGPMHSMVFTRVWVYSSPISTLPF